MTPRSALPAIRCRDRLEVITRHSVIILTLILTGLQATADLAIVVADKAPLYRASRIAGTIGEGEVAFVKTHDSEPDWLYVIIDDTSYEARKKYFRVRSDLTVALERTQLEINQKLRTINERIRDNTGRLQSLRSYIFVVEWDRAAYYRQPKWDVTTGAGVVRQSALGAGATHHVTVKQDYHFHRKIRSGKASRMIRAWEDEMAQIETENRDLNASRQALNETLTREQTQLEQITDRFERFAHQKETYLRDYYVLQSRSANLFQQKRKVRELRRGAIVRAEPSPDYDDRLKVISGGDVFDSPARSYRSHDQIELQFLVRTARLKDALAAAVREFELLRTFEAMYDSFIEDSAYTAALSGEFVPFRHGLHSDFQRPPRNAYWIVAPYGSEEVVNRLKLRRTHRRWKDEREDLHTRIYEKDREIEVLERDLLTAEQQYDALNRRLADSEYSRASTR